MMNSMKSENKLDGASNFRAWKTRIDLILAKNKMLDIVKGKIVKPEFKEGEEKEPQNVAAMDKFKDVDINAMSIIVDSIKDHLIPMLQETPPPPSVSEPEMVRYGETGTVRPSVFRGHTAPVRPGFRGFQRKLRQIKGPWGPQTSS
jgi:hypothetical protein